MTEFEHIKPSQLNLNLFDTIGGDWMLIGARVGDKHNMMTASWGGCGILWGKPVFHCYVRPQRYTYEFTEKTDVITLSFLGHGKYREAMSFCGHNSGRDCDKAKEAGLTPRLDIEGAVYYDEAETVLVGHKLYSDMLREDCFTDPTVIKQNYWAKDFHRMYICQITEILRRK